MAEVDEFLDWLEEQSYWVNSEEVEEKFPALEFKESSGITSKENEDGDIMIPKRDYRNLVKREQK